MYECMMYVVFGVINCAGLVQSWAAIVMGILSGSIPWVSMMVLHKKSSLLQKVSFHICFTFVIMPFTYLSYLVLVGF